MGFSELFGCLGGSRRTSKVESVPKLSAAIETVENRDSAPGATDSHTPQPAPRGLRKPSTTAARRNRLPANNKPPREQPEDPHPTEYLYFGTDEEGRRRGPNHMGQGGNSGFQSSTAGHRTTKASEAQGDGSGNDSSGFPNFGLSDYTQSMGYASTTYGGSLQFNYTGAQGSGVEGVAGVGPLNGQ